MHDIKHITGAASAFFGVFLVGAALLAWPSIRETRAISREIADLQVRGESLSDSLIEVSVLEDRLEAARSLVERELPIVGDSPDLADAMRRLSLLVDHERVLDQTFTAGAAFPALSPEELASLTEKPGAGAGKGGWGERQPPVPWAMPLNIEVVGTFETVFRLLTAAESMDRLVRIANVRMVCDRSEKNSARLEPLLNASIGLEAIYAVPQ